MNIHETLYFIRKKQNILQRDILTYAHSSVYSKIESGKKELKLYELIEILDRLSIPLADFFNYSTIDNEQAKFHLLLNEYKNHPHEPTVKENVCSYFHTLTFSKKMPMNKLALYILIKIFFSSKWEEIPPLMKSEKRQIFEILKEKHYFFHYDYAILTYTIHLFSDEQIDYLIQKAFPLKDTHIRSTEIKDFAGHLMNNIIVHLLKKKQFDLCLFYLSLAAEGKNHNGIRYTITIDYLENLIHYLKTKKTIYITHLVQHINYLNRIGQFSFSERLKKEIKSLLSRDKVALDLLETSVNN